MSSLLYRFYEQLLGRFGPQHWWPAQSPWEVAVGAVLVQNTNWQNVERAIAALVRSGALSPGRMAELAPAELADLIRPAGTFNVKSRRLQAVARWWLANAEAAAAGRIPLAELRASLLAVHGVGKETADSILLYAFDQPVFVVDAYTRRWLVRHRLATPGESYAAIQARFMEQLPADVVIYQEYHALIVALGKQLCRPTPRCRECVLEWHLDQV